VFYEFTHLGDNTLRIERDLDSINVSKNGVLFLLAPGAIAGIDVKGFLLQNS